MKVIYTGIESSGKSLLLSRQAEKVRRRNIGWFKVTGLKRTMAFNSPMAPEFIKLIEDSNINYIQFKNLDEIIYLEEADIFIDELIKLFTASGSTSLSEQQLNFITQGAKSGIHIYASSQDFSQVHKQFRLLVNQVFVVTKLFGSERPMQTAPPVKRVWGVIAIWQLDARSAAKAGNQEEMKVNSGVFLGRLPKLTLLKRKDTLNFQTQTRVKLSDPPPLRKYVRVCPEDGYKRVKYL